MNPPKNRPQATAPGEGPRDSLRPYKPYSSAPNSCNSDMVEGEGQEEGGSLPQPTPNNYPQQPPKTTRGPQTSVEYINRAIKTLDDLNQALQTPGGHLSALSPQLENFFRTAKTIFQDYTTTIQRAQAKEPDLKDILDEIRQVKKAVHQPLQPTMPKWSQIIAQSPLKASTPPITTEITLHLSKPATRKAVALLSNQAII